MGYLSGAQFKELHKALLSAFPVQTDLALMYQVTFEQPLSVVTVASSLSAQAFHLIEWAEAHYQTLKLIDAARTANPTNEALFECASWFGIAPKTDRLERMI